MSFNFAQATGIDDESGTYTRVRQNKLTRPHAGDTYVFLLPSGLWPSALEFHQVSPTIAREGRGLSPPV